MPNNYILLGILFCIQMSSFHCHQQNTISTNEIHQTLSNILLRQSNVTQTNPTMVPVPSPPKPSHFALELLISFLRSLSQMISPLSGLAGTFLNATITGLLTESIEQLESVSRVDERMYLMDVPGRGQFVVMEKANDADGIGPNVVPVKTEYGSQEMEMDFRNMKFLMHQQMMQSKRSIKI